METRDIFGQMAARYDTEERITSAKIISDQIRAELNEMKMNTTSWSALDYGCGTGLVGLALTGLFESVVFVDTSPQMVEQVQRKISQMKIGNATARCGDFMMAVPEDIKADCILMSQVLLHVKDYQELLGRVFQALNEDGCLLIVDFDKNEKIVSDLVHNGFSQAELARLLAEIGFTFIRARTFYHGSKLFMNQDASQFILTARK